MRNFDSWSAEHIQNCIDYSKRLLSGLNEWYGMLGRHIMEPQETQAARVAFVQFMRDTEKKLEEINRDLYRADQNFVTAVESGSKPSYAYESRKLNVKEAAPVSEKINGSLKNDTEYGFYLQKSYKKEYFFVSNAKAKTQKLVAKIISYAYGVSEDDVLDTRSKNANDYKYIANKIQPAKITFKHSDKWGDYVDIEGTKSQFSASNMDKDDTPEIEIVYL
jgi:hypothetical protein